MSELHETLTDGGENNTTVAPTASHRPDFSSEGDISGQQSEPVATMSSQNHVAKSSQTRLQEASVPGSKKDRNDAESFQQLAGGHQVELDDDYDDNSFLSWLTDSDTSVQEGGSFSSAERETPSLPNPSISNLDQVMMITQATPEAARQALLHMNGDADLAILHIVSNNDPTSEKIPLPHAHSRESPDSMVGITAPSEEEIQEDTLSDHTKHLPLIKSKLPEQECPICFDIVSSTITLNQCDHTFCLPCVQQYIHSQINEGFSARVRCPMPESVCGKLMLQHELQTALDGETFAKLDRCALESAAAYDPSLHHCPTPDCPFIAWWRDSDSDGPPFFFCPLCDATSCLKCMSTPYHKGMTCEEWERAPKQRKHEVLTNEYLRRERVRTCARCGASVMKASGCDKMKCRCGYRFCYVCGSENAQCGHTRMHHGYIDNLTGGGDFHGLVDKKSPT